MSQRTFLTLIGIFTLGLFFRFYAFHESLYFAYDQARDAYAALDIYTSGQIKFIGPPVTGNVGLFHGVLFWYVLGPLYLLFQGNFPLIAAVFRIGNALGIFLVFAIGRILFSQKIGLLAAFIFAISYEQSQYAMYVGNPSLAVISVLILMLGFTLLIQTERKRLALILIFSGAGTAAQFNFMFWYFFALVILLLFAFRSKLTNISTTDWGFGVATALISVSSFLLAEIKYGFRSITTTLNLLRQGYSILDPAESKYVLYLNKFFMMFSDNFFGRHFNQSLVILICIIVTIWLLKKAKNDLRYQLLLAWQFAWIFLMFLGGHTAYYTNAGLSTGLVISFFLFLERFNAKVPIIIPLVLIVSLLANGNAVKSQSPNSVSLEFITTPGVKLADEIRLINYIYKTADGAGFTVKQTGIPYLVQSTWSYLFHYYGERVYGYLPFWETAMVAGFPGNLPVPSLGTTCLRFRLVEPDRGLPQGLIQKDLDTENELSRPVNSRNFGNFLLETRRALDPNCHTRRP